MKLVEPRLCVEKASASDHLLLLGTRPVDVELDMGDLLLRNLQALSMESDVVLRPLGNPPEIERIDAGSLEVDRCVGCLKRIAETRAEPVVRPYKAKISAVKEVDREQQSQDHDGGNDYRLWGKARFLGGW